MSAPRAASRSCKFDLVAPATTGTYAYHCTFHAFMNGTLVVSTLSLSGPKLVIVGKSATVRGASPGTAPGTPVTIEALTSGVFTQIGATTVAADGTFSLRTPVLKTATALRARVGADISPTVDLPVAPKVTLKKATAKRTIKVTVLPARAGKARLERLNTNTFKWGTVRQVSIAGSGRATVVVPKAGSFRIMVLPAKGLVAGTSAALRFN